MNTGRWMVAGQGLLFLLVAVTAFLPGPTLYVCFGLGLALVVAGAVIALWAARRLGRALTPQPVPNGAGMAATGPYRLARHPMYSALVVICLGAAVGSGPVLCYAAVVTLAAFFRIKTRYEERLLLEVYPGYAEYAARVGRFVPWVGRLRLSTD